MAGKTPRTLPMGHEGLGGDELRSWQKSKPRARHALSNAAHAHEDRAGASG